MNALALLWTPSISSLCFLFMSICFFDFSINGSFKKYVGRKRGGGSLKCKRNRTNFGSVGQDYLYVQRIQHIKVSFLSKRRRGLFFIKRFCMNMQMFLLWSFILSLPKNSPFPSFRSLIFHSKIQKHCSTFFEDGLTP